MRPIAVGAAAPARAGRSFGYNAATNAYGDLVEMGVIDPTKVVRTALENAASVAGLMLTTEALVAERRRPSPRDPDSGDGGF